jgi:adenylosuccinate lyase
MAFGLKLVTWIDELLRHCERIGQVRERVLVTHYLFGGGNDGWLQRGDRSCSNTSPPESAWLRRRSVGAWPATDGRIRGHLSHGHRNLGRVADEVRTLSRLEFGEVEEEMDAWQGRQYHQAHKRNPERCEQVVVMVRFAAAQVGLAITGMIGDHERDSRALRIEWVCVPDVARYCLAASAILLEIVSGLIVHPDRLTKNFQDVTDRVTSERLMLELGAQMGKRDAHEIVYELTQQAMDQTVPVRELAAERKEIAENLTVPAQK